MKLDIYIENQNMSYTAFGKLIDASPQATRNYVIGSRIPHKEVMVKIHKVTGGRVAPNDFYDL